MSFRQNLHPGLVLGLGVANAWVDPAAVPKQASPHTETSLQLVSSQGPLASLGAGASVIAARGASPLCRLHPPGLDACPPPLPPDGMLSRFLTCPRQVLQNSAQVPPPPPGSLPGSTLPSSARFHSSAVVLFYYVLVAWCMKLMYYIKRGLIRGNNLISLFALSL